jgi:hypothetical protein
VRQRYRSQFLHKFCSRIYLETGSLHCDEEPSAKRPREWSDSLLPVDSVYVKSAVQALQANLSRKITLDAFTVEHKQNRFIVKESALPSFKIFPWFRRPGPGTRFRQTLKKDPSQGPTIDQVIEAVNYFLERDGNKDISEEIEFLSSRYKSMETSATSHCLSAIVDLYREFKERKRSERVPLFMTKTGSSSDDYLPIASSDYNHPPIVTLPSLDRFLDLGSQLSATISSAMVGISETARLFYESFWQLTGSSEGDETSTAWLGGVQESVEKLLSNLKELAGSQGSGLLGLLGRVDQLVTVPLGKREKERVGQEMSRLTDLLLASGGGMVAFL